MKVNGRGRGFHSLPYEVQFLILRELPPVELAMASRVCSIWKHTIDEQILGSKRERNVRRRKLANDLTDLFEELIFACATGDTIAAARILASREINPNGKWWLRTPAYELLRTLVSHPDTDLNARDKLDCNVLHIASSRGDLVALRMILASDKPKPATDSLDIHGYTALEKAVSSCEVTSAPMMEALLDAGADPNRPNRVTGRTPLHRAVIGPFMSGENTRAKSLAMIRGLLEHRETDVRIRDGAGFTARDLADDHNMQGITEVFELHQQK